MRVRNAQGKMRDEVCDIKDCNTRSDVLARYRVGPYEGFVMWRDWVLQDEHGNGVRYATCDRHSFTRDDPPTIEMMKERATT